MIIIDACMLPEGKTYSKLILLFFLAQSYLRFSMFEQVGKFDRENQG